jgi:CRP-like cAMP-binding protein
MHILLKKLNSLHDISANEQAALLATLAPPRRVTRGQDIVADGSTPKHTTVLLSGTACRYKILRKAQRHIFGFQYPGDMIDLYSYVMKLVDHGIGALSDCEVAHIPHEKISELCRKYPNVAYAFWRDSMIDTSILHSWALGGSRNTVERMANMLCEIFVRLEAVGLAKIGRPLDFNATQRDLADALGLSLVHVNKTLKVLKTKGLIGRIGMKIEILDWKRLQKIGDFDAGYLHFKKRLLEP